MKETACRLLFIQYTINSISVLTQMSVLTGRDAVRSAETDFRTVRVSLHKILGYTNTP